MNGRLLQIIRLLKFESKQMKIRHFFITLGVFVLLCSPAGAKSITGKVVGVTDGDTIKILSGGKQIKIRLYGIDTPEKKQAFGQAAKREISSLLTPLVTVKEKDIDRYGRTVGIVYTSAGENVNQEMVKSGYAWVYRKYCRSAFCADWLTLEATARKKGLGLWREKAIPPWEYRKRKER